MKGEMEPDGDTRHRRIALETVEGPTIERGPLTVRPVGRSLALRFGRGALVHTWPSAVLVSDQEGTSRIPIVNVTWLAKAVAALAALLLAYWLVIQAGRRKERQS